MEVSLAMQSENRFAFKEWAVVCAALAAGQQTLILRKGGIHEGREGFRVEHAEFWLFPTGFHQQKEDVVPEAWPLLEEVQSRTNSRDHQLNLYAVVHDVHHVVDHTALSRLTGKHIWSGSTVQQRFDYRTPGLFVLVTRIFRLPSIVQVPDSPHFAGCKSWVDLCSGLTTSGLKPVIDDLTFDRERREIQQLLAGAASSYLTPP